MRFDQKILKAINEGIRKSLLSFDDIEFNQSTGANKKVSNTIADWQWVQDNFVDLGLPSGTLWAKCNLGADSPEQPGDLYAWAELSPKDEYIWANYKYGTNVDKIQKYTKKGMQLELSDDAAYQSNINMCIPTKEQCDELIKETNVVWISINGQEFLKFESKTNDNYIIVNFELNKNVRGINNVGFWSNTVAGSFTGAGCEAFVLHYDGIGQRPICVSEYRKIWASHTSGVVGKIIYQYEIKPENIKSYK